MLSKRSLLVAMVGLNLFLLAVLLIGSYSLPAANAQARGGSASFVCVTAHAPGQAYEVFYLADLSERKLHSFFPTANHRLTHTGFVDLEREFRE